MMVKEKFTLTNLECAPFGITLRFMEALHSCRHKPPLNWPREAYELIGCEDLPRGQYFTQAF